MIDFDEFLCFLNIDVEEKLLVGCSVKKFFVLCVFCLFIDCMEKGNLDDFFLC